MFGPLVTFDQLGPLDLLGLVDRPTAGSREVSAEASDISTSRKCSLCGLSDLPGGSHHVTVPIARQQQHFLAGP